MLTLDKDGQFDSDGKKFGVIATQKGERWYFRDADSGILYASGPTPKEFAKRFWFRDDFEGSE
jgi:hypothetical protein